MTLSSWHALCIEMLYNTPGMARARGERSSAVLRWSGYILEFLLMALGLWVFISPWVLGFSDQPRAAWDAWLSGAVIFLLAFWAWWSLARPDRRRQASRRARRGGDRPASA
jgi:membrane associated rhomboid family serine protease